VNTGEERYEFTPKAKKNLLITIAVGVVLTLIGIFAVSSGGGHDEGGHNGDHAVAEKAEAGHGEEKHEEKVEAGHAAEGEGEHHGSHTPVWLKRVFSNLWINTVFFAGLAIIGVFFFAIQYAS